MMSYVIMKYDDLSMETFDAFSKVAEYSIGHKLPVSMGLVGQSLEKPSNEYVESIKTWHANGIGIWNHGYYHTDEEFSSNSYEEQCRSIIQTQKLAASALGITLDTFGSPHNNSTETTISALKEVAPEITNYMFAVDGQSRTTARQLLVRCNMEIKTGIIDFDFFIHNYELLRDLPYIIIQGHPSFWDEKNFELNEKVIKYLVTQGNTFVTPSKLPPISNETKTNDEIEKLVSYAKKHQDNLALYGAGQIGREIFRYLESQYGIRGKTFVVSDGQTINEKEICGVPVVTLSDISGKDYGVIMTLMPNFQRMIAANLEAKGMDYYQLMSEDEYLHMVNIIRLNIF